MGANILIVEDEMLIAFAVEDALADLGHHVVGIASDLESALHFADTPIDLALVDLNLRDGQTGPEIGRQLCARGTCAVLFVTANPKLLGSGVAGTIGVLTKPTSPHAVREAIDYALRLRGGETAAPPPELKLFAHAPDPPPVPRRAFVPESRR